MLYLEYEEGGWISEGYLLIIKRNGEGIKIKAVPDKVKDYLVKFYLEALRTVK